MTPQQRRSAIVVWAAMLMGCQLHRGGHGRRALAGSPRCSLRPAAISGMTRLRVVAPRVMAGPELQKQLVALRWLRVARC